MAAYADYTFYGSTYLGTAIASADFARLAFRASAVIDQVTYGRAAAIITADSDETTIEKIQLATCAVAEVLQKDDNGGTVTSEKIGSHSVTYAQKEEPAEAKYQRAARLYLWDTDLMFPGFASGEYSGDTDDE